MASHGLEPLGLHRRNPALSERNPLVNTATCRSFKLAIPVLHVGSSAVAEDFYCNGLGFVEIAVRHWKRWNGHCT